MKSILIKANFERKKAEKMLKSDKPGAYENKNLSTTNLSTPTPQTQENSRKRANIILLTLSIK